MSFRFWIISLTLTSFAATGCGYRSRALPVRLVAEHPNAAAFKDVRVAADAFDKKTSKRILNHTVNRRGYVAVLVALENKGAERAVVDGENIELEAGTGRLLKRTGSELVAKKCEKSVAAHVILFGWLAGLGAAEYNRKMAADWKEKELPEQVILEPHSSVHGLLFYTIKDFSSVTGATLVVPVAVGGSPDYTEVRCVLP